MRRIRLVYFFVRILLKILVFEASVACIYYGSLVFCVALHYVNSFALFKELISNFVEKLFCFAVQLVRVNVKCDTCLVFNIKVLNFNFRVIQNWS